MSSKLEEAFEQIQQAREQIEQVSTLLGSTVATLEEGHTLAEGAGFNSTVATYAELKSEVEELQQVVQSMHERADEIAEQITAAIGS